MRIARRDILKAGAAFAVLGLAGGFSDFARADDTHMVVTVDWPLNVGTRTTRLFVTRLERKKPRGVVLFSTGWGSWPERYQRLSAILAIEGFVVLAPLHVDSTKYPGSDAFSRQQVFMERLADMSAASTYAARNYPGLPVIAAGHSFGTLISLCEAGGLANIGHFANPAVKAALGFSSPGKVKGLIGPDSYAAVTVPTLIVTGSADTVPEFVTDPADHLFPIEASPAGGKYALVLAGADHRLAGAEQAGFERALPAVRLFVEAYGLGDAKARKRLAEWHAAEGDRFLVRER